MCLSIKSPIAIHTHLLPENIPRKYVLISYYHCDCSRIITKRLVGHFLNIRNVEQFVCAHLAYALWNVTYIVSIYAYVYWSHAIWNAIPAFPFQRYSSNYTSVYGVSSALSRKSSSTLNTRERILRNAQYSQRADIVKKDNIIRDYNKALSQFHSEATAKG